MTRATTCSRVRRFRRLAVGAVLTVSAIAVGGGSGSADRLVEAVPRSQRVAVFADSVGLGARSAIPAAFPADWSVHVDGQPARFVEQLERDFVRYRMAVDPEWFGDHVVIAGGYNYPYWDPERFDRSIDSIIRTLTDAGVTNVYWVTLREIDPQYISGAAWRQVQPYYWYFPTVNEHLERALDRHPNLTLIDWAAIANRSGITYDAIHLNTTGAALYADKIRSTITSTATKVAEGSTTRIAVPDPAGVGAVAVNLTVTQPRHRGYLTAHSCDEPRPESSNHNFLRDEVVAHATVVPVGASGEICVYASRATNLLVDLTGRFATDTIGDLPSARLLDTRGGGAPAPAGGSIEIDVGTTDPAVFTVTAIGARERGFVRLAPCGDQGDTSNVNMEGPAPVPNAAIARPAPDGRLCVRSSTAAHLVVDRLTDLTAGDALTVAPARRIADTRSGDLLPAGGTLRLTADDLGVDDATTGVLLNLTATRSARGFVTAGSCSGPAPETSSLNLAPGGAVANFVVLAPDARGEICLRTTGATHLVVDVQGRLGAGFEGASTRLLDTRD